MKNQLLFAIFCSLITFQIASAQRPSGAGSQRQVNIIGQVIDADAGVPVEFATVTILSKSDSVIVTGSITDELGKFTIEVPAGRYYAQVEFISYLTLVIEEIPMPQGNPSINLGILKIAADSKMLDEVVVQAEKSTMQMALDKRIFNVGKDLANTGGSALQVLDNVPSVTVDVEGQVSLRGGNARILVDGKPSALVRDANGLRSIPANLIERIEVITNPSARYEAEGMSGIINIVLKKNKTKGINGSFDVNAGYPDNYGGALNMNYRKDKINFFTNFGVNYQVAPGVGGNKQERFLRDTLFITDIDRKRERVGFSTNLRLGMDYYLSDNDIFTTSFQYRVGNNNNSTRVNYLDYLTNRNANSLYEVTNRTDDEEETRTNLEYALSYKKLFEKKGHELNLDVRYQDNIDNESSDYREVYFDGKSNPLGREDLLQRSTGLEGDNTLLLRADYIYPFAKQGKLEFGYLGSVRNIRNDYLVEEFADNEWVNLVGLSNNFKYEEGIHAVYASMGNKMNKFSYQLGLRGEYSDISTQLLQTNEVNDRNYFNLFPSVFLTYDLPNNNAVQLSYSRRIRRPGFRELNPFFTFSDSRNLFNGNPNLDPEFTNSFEAGHIKYWDKGSLGSSIYYRHTEGVIQRIIVVDQETGNTNRRPENLATQDSYGLEFNYSLDPYKWWRLSGDFNFFRAVTSGDFINSRGQLQSLDADAYSWFTRFTSRTTFWKNTDLQLRLNYRAPQITTQGRDKAITAIDLGLSKDILKNKGTLTLSIQDVFNSRRYRSTINQPDFFSEIDFQWRARQTTLSFNYRLNQQQRKGADRGGRQSGGNYGGGEEF